MGNYISKYKRGRIRNKLDKDFRENVDWLYNRISREQHEWLKTYLLHLDKSHRVDINSERTKKVHHDVTEILERISARIGELDRRFAGTLVPMGSANNQTKLGDSDEFDFVNELDLITLLERRGTFKRMIDNRIALNMDSGTYCEMVKCEPESDVVFDKVKAHYLFTDILSKVLSELDLPPGWQHGGFRRPNFSGVRRQGPSCVIQFDYQSTKHQVPLRMSVDFVPMIRIPLSADEACVKLNSFLRQEAKIKYCWVYLMLGGGFYCGHAEELFLNKYSAESTAKTLIRIAKTLRIVSHMALTSYPSKYNVIELLELEKYWKSGKRRQHVFRESDCLKLLPGNEDYVSYSDLGETGTDSYTTVKSYWIKRSVLEMMSVDESHGHGWTDDDLPELVMAVYRLINEASYPSTNICQSPFYDKQNISVPLDYVCKPTTPKGSPPTQKWSTDSKLIDAQPFMSKVRIPWNDFFHENNENRVGRIICIFQLFRCVCEGKKTAELVIYNDLSQNELEHFVSKKEFNKLRDRFKKTRQSRDTQTDAWCDTETDTSDDTETGT